ncbi:MAG: GNAT family N-acetyltransferase [Acidimicrobiales bacterium]|nr:MAG: GNAT family N-acetyltransferase [Acidimicrobiales bacterium]
MHVRPLLQTTDEQFASALAVQQRAEQAYDPQVPPITAEELRLLGAHDRSNANRHERFVVLDADETSAVCHLEFELDEANAHLASTEIFGAADDPDAGRAGLATMLDLVEEDGRTSVLGWGPQLPAESAFWEGLGAELRYRERISVLDVAAVDADLMASWIDQRNERAADVQLVRFINRCPDEHLDAWTASRSAMSDAPMEGLDINDTVYDSADIREDEASLVALGYRMMYLLALTPDGAPVGHTTVRVNTHRPGASDQWDTVVLADHRRRGVGRWLKAEMWRWLRETEPDVTRLGTGNAQSNDPMLAINVAMGYVPLCVFGAWQADVTTYRQALA